MIEFLASVLENPFSNQVIGLTAFHVAAMYNKPEALTCLLKIKDDPNVKVSNGHYTYNGATPLHFAAEKGHLECVKILMNCGLSPDCKKSGGYTPMHLAAENGHDEVVEYLAKFTDNPNQSTLISTIDTSGQLLHSKSQYETPLKLALKKNHNKVVQVLLKILSEKMNSDQILKMLSEKMNCNPQDTMNTLRLICL